MVQILYRGILGGTHSWAVVGGELCLALDRLGYDIGVHCTNKESEIASEQLRKLIDRSGKRSPIGLGYTIPRNVRLFNADKKICIYNYETTVLPPGWVKDLNQYSDLILPSSEFAKEVFTKNGVLHSKTFVLPHGIDTNIYNPDIQPVDFHTDKFKFLCVAQPHARKGLDILLKAFAREFASTEDVVLLLKTSFVSEYRKAHYEIDIKETLSELKKEHAVPEIRLLVDRLDTLAPLYTGADCFVLPTRSECFCIPALEAMACKLPVIITGYGGQVDFCTKSNSLLISYKMVDAPKTMQYWHYDPRGRIAEPDIDHLCTLMRYAYKNREEMRKRAEIAYEQTMPKYTWDNVAEQLINLIKQQHWGKNITFHRKKRQDINVPDLKTLERSRSSGYQRVIAQRKERLQILEKEIETKRQEAEQIRRQLLVSEQNPSALQNSLTKRFEGKVSIAILNYNTKSHIVDCINSIKNNTFDIDYEIVVVDNGSSDGSVEVLRSFDNIKLIENETNVGVSKGWNQAIQSIDSKNDIVILNSDIIVTKNWLTKLNEVAYNDQLIGVVGCRLKNRNNGHLLHTGALIKKNGMGEENEWGISLEDYGQCKINKQVQIVVGACMYLKRTVLDSVGLFDEQFSPAYFEDSDMCLRIAQAGYKVFYCGEVTLFHEHSATSRVNNINTSSMLSVNRIKFIKKWGSYLSKKDFGIEIKGPIFGVTGYAEACRGLTTGLTENNVDVAFRPIEGHPSEQKFQNKMTNLIVQDAIDNTANYDVGMVFYIADFFTQHLQHKKRRIGYTMLEVDLVPQSWVQYINTYLTELWVPSTFNQGTFRNSGVQVPIKIVPLGVDVSRFNPYVEPLLPKSDKFVFLSVCEWGERKNIHLLMRAFQTEFAKNDEVQLMLKISCHDPMVNIEKEIKQYNLKNVVLFAQECSGHQMASLYKSADCFVLPSSGEGWGLPYAEAMAVGLPTIGTGWSANLDFMNHENSYLINCERLVPAMAACPFYAGFNWALPDVKHLGQLMKYVYENQTESRKKGIIASKHIIENFSLTKVAKIAKKHLLAQ